MTATTNATKILLGRDVFRAYLECNDKVRASVVRLYKALFSGELDEDDERATTTLLEELLFPGSCGRKNSSLDPQEELVPGEKLDRDTQTILKAKKDEVASFFSRVKSLMEQKGVTQAELAAKIEISQPAISLFLQRRSRPQQQTVLRIAEALAVPPGELWPGFDEAR